MRKNKVLIIVLLALLALPIPLSLISWIGTIMALPVILELAGIIEAALKGAADWFSVLQFTHRIIFIIAILLAGTYGITYFFSAYITIKNKMIKGMSFLPLLHIAVFVVCYHLSVWLGQVEGI